MEYNEGEKLRFGPSLGGGGGGAPPPSPGVGEVLPRLAFPTSFLKENWLPSLPDEAPRRTTLLRSQCFGVSSVVVNDMDFQENGETDEGRDGDGSGEKERGGAKVQQGRPPQLTTVGRSVIVSRISREKAPNVLPARKVNPKVHPFHCSPSPCRRCSVWHQGHREQRQHRRCVRGRAFLKTIVSMVG